MFIQAYEASTFDNPNFICLYKDEKDYFIKLDYSLDIISNFDGLFHIREWKIEDVKYDKKRDEKERGNRSDTDFELILNKLISDCATTFNYCLIPIQL